MKALSVAVALLALSQPVLAGGLSEALVEPEVIAEETQAATSGGFIIPLCSIRLCWGWG